MHKKNAEIKQNLKVILCNLGIQYIEESLRCSDRVCRICGGNIYKYVCVHDLEGCYIETIINKQLWRR